MIKRNNTPHDDERHTGFALEGSHASYKYRLSQGEEDFDGRARYANFYYW